MSFKDRLRKLVYNPVFDIVIFTVIILSTLLLMVEKMFNFGADARAALEVIDLVVLCIFLVEFTLKIILDGGKYFIKNYGWIDLIATLPILVPLVNFIFVHFYVQFILTAAATSTLSGMRVFRILRVVRLLRILRVVRLLKVFGYINKYSAKAKKGPDMPMTIPALSVLVFVILSYTVILYQENVLVNQATVNSAAVLEKTTEYNADMIFSSHPDILVLYSKNVIKRRISDAELMANYANDEHITVTDKDKNFMVVSVKSQKDILKFHELFVIIMEILMILSYMAFARTRIVLGKKGA